MSGSYWCVVGNKCGRVISNTTVVLTRYKLEKKNFGARTVEVMEGKSLKLKIDDYFQSSEFKHAWGINKWPIKASPFDRHLPMGRRLGVDLFGNLHFAYVLQSDSVLENFVYKSLTFDLFDDAHIGGSYTFLNVTKNPKGIVPFPPKLAFATSSNIVALEGENKTLECFFYGYPLPEYKWSFVGHKDWDDRRYFTSSETNLTLLDVRAEDAGTYTVVGSNHLGSGECVFHVSVEAFPRFKLEHDSPKNMNLTEGQDVVINCAPFSLPPPSIQWIINGRNVDAHDLPPNVEMAANKTFLKIKKLSKDGRGSESMVVQCNATNKHGYMLKAGYINVLRRTKIVVDEEVVYTETQESSSSSSSSSKTFEISGSSESSGSSSTGSSGSSSPSSWSSGKSPSANVPHDPSYSPPDSPYLPPPHSPLSRQPSTTSIPPMQNDKEEKELKYKCKGVYDPATPSKPKWYQLRKNISENGSKQANDYEELTASDPPHIMLYEEMEGNVQVSRLVLRKEKNTSWAGLPHRFKCIVDNGYTKDEKVVDVFDPEALKPAVDDKERKNGNNPEKELCDQEFKSYSRDDTESKFQSKKLMTADGYVLSDDDDISLNDYGLSDGGRFTEDGSFVGAYVISPGTRSLKIRKEIVKDHYPNNLYVGQNIHSSSGVFYTMPPSYREESMPAQQFQHQQQHSFEQQQHFIQPQVAHQQHYIVDHSQSTLGQPQHILIDQQNVSNVQHVAVLKHEVQQQQQQQQQQQHQFDHGQPDSQQFMMMIHQQQHHQQQQQEEHEEEGKKPTYQSCLDISSNKPAADMPEYHTFTKTTKIVYS
ncbi:hypothetical protein HELRODRAFT_179440 [Helobdella robusta]|uniref:Ig-like domain-containing protein n=1 Tax=Helobdella robusta TaxID=6412 RepID=T1FEP9_HELRO|nr:hypothetical protein HELRODRAFT_179440 [Helobdella robusta]ESN95369.1 hypothetical protein HELRODRAFT_179440 [Helobdella robusta]